MGQGRRKVECRNLQSRLEAYFEKTRGIEIGGNLCMYMTSMRPNEAMHEWIIRQEDELKESINNPMEPTAFLTPPGTAGLFLITKVNGKCFYLKWQCDPPNLKWSIVTSVDKNKQHMCRLSGGIGALPCLSKVKV